MFVSKTKHKLIKLLHSPPVSKCFPLTISINATYQRLLWAEEWQMIIIVAVVVIRLNYLNTYFLINTDIDLFAYHDDYWEHFTIKVH